MSLAIIRRAILAAAFATTQYAAAQTAVPPYHVVRRITIGRFINPAVVPGKPYHYEALADFLSVDSANRRLYGLGTAVLAIDHDTIVGKVPGVAAGGYVLAPEFGKGLTRKGTVFDLATLKPTGTIGASGDATVYDAVTHRAFLLDDTVTAVDMGTASVVARRHIGNRLESAVADGAGKLFINRKDSSLVLKVDALSLTVEARYPVPDCQEPEGLSIDQVHRRLFVGCDQAMVVIDADNGTVIARIRVTGHGDQNAFDPGTMLAFSANWPDSTLTVVHEDNPNTFTVVQTVKIGGRSNSVAVDPRTHKVYAFYYDGDVRPAGLEDLKRFVLKVAILAPQQPEQRAGIPVEDILTTHMIGEYSEPTFSPDGRWLAYVVRDNQRSGGAGVGGRRSGISFGGVGANVVLLDVETGVVKNLTGGTGDNWGATWSPDGQHLAFFSDRDGGDSARIWVWDRRTGQLRKLAGIAVQSRGMQWTPNSKRILVMAAPRQHGGDRSMAVAGERDAADARDVDSTTPSPVARYSFHPQRDSANAGSTSDPWSLEASTGSMVLIGLDHGDVRTLIDRQRIVTFVLSPDGTHVAYTSPTRFERPGSQQVLWDLRSIDLVSGADALIAHDIRLRTDGGSFSWSPDGQALAYQVGGMEERANDCYVVSLRDRQPQKLALTSPHADTGTETTLDPPLWSRQRQLFFVRRGTLWRGEIDHGTAAAVATIADRTIVALVARGPNELWTDPDDSATVVQTYDKTGKQDGFYRIDLATGRSTKLLERGQCYRCVQQMRSVVASPNGRQLMYFAEDASHPNDLWLTDATFRTPRRLTHLNPQFDQDTLGSARLIDWLSLDGDVLHGVLLLPSGYREGTRYPLIVYVYGGELMSNRFDRFGSAGNGPFNMQMFATRGYAVLLPDAPQHAGTPMVDLAKTVLPGVNKAIEMGIADPARLGIMGHSYGGYTTLSLIVQTTRFKAAVAADGKADLLSSYGQMDSSGAAFGTSIAEGGQGLLRGTPWQVRDRYIENSPIVYLDRVTTPLLLIHGAADETVAPFLSDEVFVGLRRLGKEVEYLKYRGEGHSPSGWRYSNQMDYCHHLISWFDDHL